MSVNHYSTDHHHTLLWQHRHTTDTTETTTTATWLNDDQKESLFEKSLTPSDVGKLNRLVIPKQHAEKYFPLNAVVSSGADTSSSSSSEKGMLLNFEDELGKCWRFRYSYWNSSQSYVLTKGWSRFVKDKQLDPGDVVFFQRHRSDPLRLFIGWRRRGHDSSAATNSAANTTSYSSSMAAPPYHQTHASSNYSNPPSHLEYSHYGAAVATAADTHSTPSSSAVGSSRTLRLFGVNLECQMDEDDGDDSVAAASAAAVECPDGYYGQNMYYYYSPHPHNVNIAFTGDTMKQEGDRRG